MIGRGLSFRSQIVLLTAAVTAVAMILLSVVLQLILARVTDGDLDRGLRDRTDPVVAAATADPSGDVPDAVLGPGIAVFDEAGVLVAGSTPNSLRGTYERLARVRRETAVDVEDRSRVRAQPFTTASGERGVVVAAEATRPYEEAERLALMVTLVTGVLTTAAAAAVAAWTTRRALRPVTEMARTADDWSEHDLGRRFATGETTSELGSLAATLDHLLDKVAAAIRSEQRLTSELAHELRTPLTAIQGTSDLMLMRDAGALPAATIEDLREISAASRRMSSTITTLLDLARSGSSAGAPASYPLARAVDDVLHEIPPGDVDVRVRLDGVSRVSVAVPATLAVRTLAPVVENAVRHATSWVALDATLHDGAVEVLVRDDGPGVDPAVADVMFEPGRSGDGGTGLGLAIARRIARAAGGDVLHTAPQDGSGPTGFVVRLPLG